MIATATVSTITIAVAAESPPRKATSATWPAPSFSGSAEHRHVAVDLAGREGGKAGERERDDEEVDERRGRAGTARRRGARPRRRGSRPPPCGTGAAGGARRRPASSVSVTKEPGSEVRAKNSKSPRRSVEPARDLVEAAEHPERHVRADDEEGDELDDRFERDRQHQPVLVLGRVGVAGAERHREAGEHQRHDEREVAEHRHRAPDDAALGRRQEHVERGRHGLELQRDVGHGADHRDHADDRRDALALAVAGGDEVGDRGDVLRLGDPHHPRDERVAEPDHQDRADIDA